MSLFFTGTMGLISSAVGVTISGFVVSYFKPSARKITGWNVMVEALGALSMLVYAHLGCSNYNLHGQWGTDDRYKDLTEWLIFTYHYGIFWENSEKTTISRLFILQNSTIEAITSCYRESC